MDQAGREPGDSPPVIGGGLGRWIDGRTGWVTAARRFLDEEIPASSGWLQALGSVVLFLFLTQAFTGVLLSLNYAPTPGQAYNSLQYILTEVTGGRLVRGLHHWGASMMIVVLVLHMAQVFVCGAYKRPREVTWTVGVVLFLITLAFGLTGYLLPWDNRAYWGTVVTTKIAGQAPLVGRYVQRLMGAEHGVGAVTMARFYAAHTLILPALAFLLIGLHIHLVRRHGVTPAPFDSRPRRRFFPRQALIDAGMMFAAFAALFVLAVAAPAPLEGLADPADSNFIPRPEWYFLFLFQVLKLFQGPLEAIASVALPTAAVGALFAVPFVDRAGVKRVAERTLAIGLLVLWTTAWASLTLAAVAGSPATPPGARLFAANGCGKCHMINGVGGRIGPSLNGVGRRRSREWISRQLVDPESQTPDTVMPAFDLPPRDRDLLINYLLSLPDR